MCCSCSGTITLRWKILLPAYRTPRARGSGPRYSQAKWPSCTARYFKWFPAQELYVARHVPQWHLWCCLARSRCERICENIINSEHDRARQRSDHDSAHCICQFGVSTTEISDHDLCRAHCIYQFGVVQAISRMLHWNWRWKRCVTCRRSFFAFHDGIKKAFWVSLWDGTAKITPELMSLSAFQTTQNFEKKQNSYNIANNTKQHRLIPSNFNQI